MQFAIFLSIKIGLKMIKVTRVCNAKRPGGSTGNQNNSMSACLVHNFDVIPGLKVLIWVLSILIFPDKRGSKNQIKS